MPPFGAIKRRDLIHALRQLGFDGPFPGGNHQYMSKAQLKVSIPNPEERQYQQARLLALTLRAAIEPARHLQCLLAKFHQKNPELSLAQQQRQSKML